MMRFQKKFIFLFLTVLSVLVVMCTKPSEPEFNNPYDELGGAFVPYAELMTLEADSIRALEAWSGGVFTTDYGKPVISKGVCWSTSQNPTTNNSCTSDGGGTGSFISNLTNLSPDTRYFVRAYASNSIGTAYGDQREFRTLVQVKLPAVSTSSVSSITSTSAVSGGNVTDDGRGTVIKRGVCWSTSQNPTTNNSCTSDSSGIGSFISNKTNLNPDTRYYVRAYATNSAGTSYGNQREFRTEWPRDTETAVVDVFSVTGRVWMDRNLGASRRATSSTNSQSYGDLYQWGRSADGHQKRNSPTTSTLSRTDQPGHGSFIRGSSDWRSPQNNNLWQQINGINNPCPVGYRLPTEAEWEAERRRWNSNNAIGAFNSSLRLPVAGTRDSSSGSLVHDDSRGYYWSGTVSGSDAQSLFFNSSTAFMFNSLRAYGYSVRCLKD